MIRFDSDYCEGAHPQVMQALERTNLEQTSGYGVRMRRCIFWSAERRQI